MPTFRVASFNIKHGLSPGGRVDNEALVSACADLDLDVLALQEVDRGRRRSGRLDQAAAVARACGMTHVFGRTVARPWDGAYGNALLVRGTFVEIEHWRLPRVDRAEPRAAIVASALLENRRLSVAATHLSVRLVHNEPQLPVVLEVLTAHPRPWLLLGDLNRGPVSVEPHLRRAGFETADTSAPTFPASDPRARIDHVAVAALDVQQVEVVEMPVSDHRALVVTVSWR
jgi:endonuclease/exonuclease/phosphatase family metal-dependent hydrolase